MMPKEKRTILFLSPFKKCRSPVCMKKWWNTEGRQYCLSSPLHLPVQPVWCRRPPRVSNRCIMPVYKRRRKVNPNDAGPLKVDFCGMTRWAIHGKKYVVFHPQICYLDGSKTAIPPPKIYSNGRDRRLVSKSPYYKATSKRCGLVAKGTHAKDGLQKWGRSFHQCHH